MYMYTKTLLIFPSNTRSTSFFLFFLILHEVGSIFLLYKWLKLRGVMLLCKQNKAVIKLIAMYEQVQCYPTSNQF